MTSREIEDETPADRLRLAMRAAGIGAWDFDPVTQELEWDERCKELFGLPASAAISYDGTFLAGLHPADRERTHMSVQAALNPDGPGAYDVEFRTIGIEDGVERWLRATGRTVFEGGRARRFIGTVQDITSRKQAEQGFALVSRIGAMVAAELDLQKIVQTITDAGVEISHADFGAFFYNLIDDRGERYMLYTLSGAPREAFEKYPMPRATAVFEPTFSGRGIVRSDNIRLDPRYGKNSPRSGMPEGHLPVTSYLAVPVISRSGEVLGGLFFGHHAPAVFKAEHEEQLVGIAAHAAIAIDNARLYQAVQRSKESLEQQVAQEIAERIRTQDALRQSQKMEAIGQLTGGIAHDFNNLLGAIGGSLSLIERRLTDGKEGAERYIKAGRDAVRRAATLTQRLLAFSRRQTLDPKPADVNRVIAGMEELVRRTVGPGIDVEVVGAGGLWLTKIDTPQLESAVLNLCINARDAMSPLGGRLTIETANKWLDERGASERDLPPGQYISVCVTDTGTGMAADVIERAFEPFFTTKPLGQGTGLGLSMVYGFVRQSGGQVRIYSEVGKGTTMCLYLPRYFGAVESGDDLPCIEVLPGGGETVLVVDDEPTLRMLITDVLEEACYHVLSAADGPAALRYVESGAPIHLMITDVGLPGGMNGRQVADAARRLRPELKCLFITGYAENAVIGNGDLDPGMEVLTKPFEISMLADKVRSMIDASVPQGERKT